MIKVIPFINTFGDEKFKEFLMSPFTIDVLFPVLGDTSCETLFEGWRGKDMLNWYKFVSDDKTTLEFYSTHYILKKSKDTLEHKLPLPKTINDFIVDMDRLGVQLYWLQWVDDNFEPKVYRHKDEIKEYFTNLLEKMGKSHELL